ncbi:MFS transporter [Boudabousia marimammalium]|uniref:Major facilitator superfamily (MFS) profile domain-containing protein n=1 Tax=Boudabousia marimammalium TaxID=156892 RepID=A0A1Q5PP72_9ACTO|nr:MFS transporter [Boudabousia marimammalium]OKL49225.1 hypothetical protein BM477_04335 [Boudabousia marimammalium]
MEEKQETTVHAIRVPGTLAILVTVLFGRLPQGMVSLAFIQFIRDEGGSFAYASALVSTFVIAGTLGQPLFGRLIDRFGSARIIIGTGTIASMAFAGLALTPTGLVWLVLPLGAIAGFATPPLESAARVYWPRMMKRGTQLDQAYGLDLMGQQLIYVFGPLLSALGIAWLGSRGNLWGIVAIGLFGALAFALIPEPAKRAEEAAPAGIVKHQSLISDAFFTRLLIFMFGLGVPVGVQAIAATNYGEFHGSATASGFAFAAYACGGTLGALSVSKLKTGTMNLRQISFIGVAVAVGYAPLAFLGAPLWLYCVLSVLSGLAFPIGLTAGFQMVERTCLPTRLAEANGWVIAVVNLGVALGAMGAGPLVDWLGKIPGITTAVILAAFVSLAGVATIWNLDATSRLRR